jgi:hypothetical protein
MPQKRPFPPYSTPAELAKGKRKTVLTLALAVGAVLLAIVARRVVEDDRLVTAYAAAAILWSAVALGEAVRWAHTGDLGPVD